MDFGHRTHRQTIRHIRDLGYRAGVIKEATPPVQIFTDGANWAIDWVSQCIARGVNEQYPGLAATTTRIDKLQGAAVFFTSRHQWMHQRHHISRTNKQAVLSLHGLQKTNEETDPAAREMIDHQDTLSKVVTSCDGLHRQLAELGVREDKIRSIPLPTDTGLFVPATPERRAKVRAELGIPEGRICIGSFQKDGVGWGEGDEPKLVKGPDILVEVLSRLAKDHPIFVLLTGPGRGFVKKHLEREGIPYLHKEVQEIEGIVRFYHALDLYLITARDEGGPLSIPEGLACGVPLVSFPVGMAPDFISHMENGMLSESFDAGELLGHADTVISDASLKESLARKAPGTVAQLDYRPVSKRYLNEVFSPMLMELGHEDLHSN